MALANYGIKLSEGELLDQIKPDYGQGFSNIWNTTIAKLSASYGLQTTMYALWPLFKPDVFSRAAKEFNSDPEHFDPMKYENPEDKDDMPEPLILAYKEAFLAVEKGCSVLYGSLSANHIREILSEGGLIQTSVKVNRLYSDAPEGFHSLLIYGSDNASVEYHDPFVGPHLSVSMGSLIEATTDVGAFIAYRCPEELS